MRAGRFTHTLSVCRIDINFALIGATEPVYPFIHSTQCSCPVLSTEVDLSIVGSRCLSLAGCSGAFHNEMNPIIRHIADFTRYTEIYRRRQNQEICDEESDDNHMVYIERQLLSIPFDHHHLHIDNSSIEGCCRLAMLLFVNTVLWHGTHTRAFCFIKRGLTITIGWSSNPNIIRSLVIRLKIALEGMDLQAFYGSYPNMSIWVLFLGGNSSVWQTERAWFVSQLASANISLSLGHWEDVRESLLGFFYLDSAHQDAFQALWAEVQRVVALS
jgi:hypothetical protein